jgi:hypothetical protein
LARDAEAPGLAARLSQIGCYLRRLPEKEQGLRRGARFVLSCCAGALSCVPVYGYSNRGALRRGDG